MMKFDREEKSFCCLSGNALKLIAALSMMIDHIGVIFFPGVDIFRIIGRLAFPVFAFMVSEGARYTRNKERYFFTIFILGAACQIFYYIFESSLYMGILITFSLSVLLIYALRNFKEAVFSKSLSTFGKCVSFFTFLLTLSAVYLTDRYFVIDYGFWGIMLPVFASVFASDFENPPEVLKRLDNIPFRVLMLGVGLIILYADLKGFQAYALFSIPLLFFYSGKRGKLKMKYFFYIFYPLHLVILQGIYMLLG